MPTNRRLLLRRLTHGPLVDGLAGLALRLLGSRVRVASRVWLCVDPRDWRARRLFLAQRPLDRYAAAAFGLGCELVRPDTLLDVGANYGEISLSAPMDAVASIHLIEPNPILRDCLKNTIDRWRGAATIRLHESAAGDRSGVVPLYVPTTSSGLASLTEPSDVATTEYSVPLSTVDSLLEGTSVKRLVFKIDVEGHELEVLEGMTATLARASDFAGVCEVSHASAELATYLHQRFRVFRLTQRGLRPVAFSGTAGLTAGGGYTKDVLLRPLHDRLGARR